MINACKYASADNYLQTTSHHTTSKRQQVASSAYLGTCTCTRLDSTKFDQDKTRPNTIQIIPFGFYLAGQNPDLMMMENHAGTTTTTTTMERDNVCFCCYYQNHKNLRGRINKKTFLLDFQKKKKKAYPPQSAYQVQCSLSLRQPVSLFLSLSFFCARCISEKIATSSPLFTTIINIDPSIKPKGRRKEEEEGRKRKEEEGASPTYLPA